MGGRIFTHRAKPGQQTSFLASTSNIHVDNFIAHDPYPTMNAFQLQAMPAELLDKDWTGIAALPVFLTNITYANVQINAVSTQRECTGGGCNCIPDARTGSSLPYGMPNIIQGWAASALITNINFKNVQIAGVDIQDMLSGTAPGYFNVSTDCVTDISVDGVKVIGQKQGHKDLAKNCPLWARSNFCKDADTSSSPGTDFMIQVCPTSCAGTPGCTTANYGNHSWDDRTCMKNCGATMVRTTSTCSSSCAQQCLSNCNCNGGNGLRL